MRRSSHAFRAETRRLFLIVGLCLSPALRGAEDRPQLPVEVYEWSIWVGSPAQTSLNEARIYRNAMPGPVGTVRPKIEGPELDRQFPVAPISVVQFFGEPTKDVDFDLRVKKGTVLAHWPQGTERSGGLRWYKTNLLAIPPGGHRARLHPRRPLVPEAPAVGPHALPQARDEGRTVPGL